LSKLAEMSNVSASYTARGTPSWMAQEIICSGRYSFASDIWAVGCVIIEMVTGKVPWEELGLREPMALMMNIATAVQGPKIPIECMSDDLIDLTSKCLSMKPEDRPSASKLLKHPFLTKNLESKQKQNNVTETLQEFSDYEHTLTAEVVQHNIHINVQ
jgi:serine/threonine protein kinase